jgi:hypothetical protein
MPLSVFSRPLIERYVAKYPWTKAIRRRSSQSSRARAGEPAIEEQSVAEQLVAQAREKGVELVGPGGLLSQLTKRVLETALDAEMTDHLGYDKHDQPAATAATPATGCGRRRC